MRVAAASRSRSAIAPRSANVGPCVAAGQHRARRPRLVTVRVRQRSRFSSRHGAGLRTTGLRDKLLQILVEPGDGLIETIGLVLWLNEHVAFAGINNELGRNAQCS